MLQVVRSDDEERGECASGHELLPAIRRRVDARRIMAIGGTPFNGAELSR
jgi:hypothetical protein